MLNKKTCQSVSVAASAVVHIAHASCYCQTCVKSQFCFLPLYNDKVMLYETRGYRISVKIDITRLKEHAQNSSSLLPPPYKIWLCLPIPQEKFCFGSNSPLLSTHGLTLQCDQTFKKSLPIFRRNRRTAF